VAKERDANMNTTFYFDKIAIPGFTTLLKKYNVDEFASPYRSTIPLLSLVKDGQPMLRDILAAMAPPMDFHFEYTVKPPKGDGNSSHTDLMIPLRCLAIEAKWTEAVSDTVAAWLGNKEREHSIRSSENRGSKNRNDVLSGWLSLLEPHAGHELIPAKFADCIYQMVHRAASACSRSIHPQLAYFKFTPSPVPSAARCDKYIDALKLLHSRLGNPSDYPFFFVEIQIAPTDAFRVIEPLPKGETATAKKVRKTVRDSKLFEFLSYRIHRIGSSPISPSEQDTKPTVEESEENTKPISEATALTDRFDRALLYAAHVHGGQVRKGTPTPYIAHLLAVAATVLEYNGSEDMAIAALLHDAVEDQGGPSRLADIRNRFGYHVADIVLACSDSVSNTSGCEPKEDWRIRKTRYLEHVRLVDEDILWVSLADKYITRGQSFATCGSERLARRSLTGSRYPKKTRCGITANWLRCLKIACPGSNWRTS
jgi:hypothetical protein